VINVVAVLPQLRKSWPGASPCDAPLGQQSHCICWFHWLKFYDVVTQACVSAGGLGYL